MTQDQPQTPPNQPQPTPPPEAPPDEATLTEVTLTDETLADAIRGDVPPEERQLQSTDSPPEEAVASIEVSAPEVSAPENQPVPPPAPAVATTSTPSPQPVEEPDSASRSPSSSRVAALIRLVGQLWGIVLPILVIVGRWAWQVTLVTLKWIREAWKVVLPRIRTLLPEGWRKLPDWALTTVAVSLLVFVLWLTVQLLPGKAPATAIDRPSPALNAPAPEAPALPDPEQITSIQTQVAEVTEPYAGGLIQAVQPNFQTHLLTVQLGDAWFNLDTASQAQLANELLKRSRKLDFDALEITDAEGELLARSPVVGKKVVIYGRVRDEA